MFLQNEQAEFAEILFSEDAHTDGVRFSQNMLIYRNNITTNLMQTLHNTYPLIAQLVGDDFFCLAIKEYIYLYPSRSGNLHDYGEYFSDFLAEYSPVKGLPYLVEIAKFEWICHQLHFASDHAAMDRVALAKLSPEQYDQIHFILHPASRVIKFHYPLLHIVDLCKGETDQQIDINQGGVNLLIIRRHLDIMLQPLSAADFTFLSALEHNASLSEALEEALHVDSEFNLETRLPAWIQDKTIVDVII